MASLEETLYDREWRLSNLYYIVDKQGNKTLFKPNPIQAIVNKSNSKRKMILKARQFGISTNELIKMLDFVMFNRNVTACVLAHEQDGIKKLFQIIRRAYDFCDPEIKPEIDRGGGSMYEMYFPELNSRILADLEIRGSTVQWLHISEAAFMRDNSRLMASLQAVPIETGIATIETTANGLGNHFYDMWSDTEQPYEKMFFPWYQFSDYRLATGPLQKTEEEKALAKKAKKLIGVDISDEQLAFRRFKKSELKSTGHDGSRVTFEQEYPEDDQTCFLSSGLAIFDLVKIKQKIDDSLDPIEDNGWLRIYHRMDKTKMYVAGADTSEGVNQDFSVGVVLEVQSRKVVAVCRSNKWKPSEFAEHLDDMCERFRVPSRGLPLLAVERNNHGHAVILKLEESIGYSNLYRHPDEKIGWRTDMVSRPIMMNAIVDAIENDIIQVNDRAILNECLTLVNTTGKIEAADKKHDDCIVATAIALQMMLGSSNLSIYDNIENRIMI